MPFEIGNTQNSRAGKIGARMKMYKEVSEQLIALSPEYNELLSLQLKGQEFNDAQREAMDRFERMYEFARPKLARTELRAEVQHTLTIDPLQYATITGRIPHTPKLTQGQGQERLSGLRDNHGQAVAASMVPREDSQSLDDGGVRSDQTPDDNPSTTSREEPVSQ